MGIERFMRLRVTAGGHGNSCSRLPMEEADAFRDMALNTTDNIYLAARTHQQKKRLQSIVNKSKGFLYLSLSMGSQAT